MNNSSTTLITTHTSAQGYYGESGSVGQNNQQQVNNSQEEEDKCRNTTKILAFSTFLIALSIGGYFTADLLANKGESVKLQKPTNKENINIYDIIDHDANYYQTDLSQDVRLNADIIIPPKQHYYSSNSYSPYQAPPQSGQGQKSSDDVSMMRVINCDQDRDKSDDEETYQSDIRAVANYIKTYWISYEASIQTQTGTDPSCLTDKFEQGEVVCKDVTCIYELSC